MDRYKTSIMINIAVYQQRKLLMPTVKQKTSKLFLFQFFLSIFECSSFDFEFLNFEF